MFVQVIATNGVSILSYDMISWVDDQSIGDKYGADQYKATAHFFVYLIKWAELPEETLS